MTEGCGGLPMTTIRSDRRIASSMPWVTMRTISVSLSLCHSSTS